MVEYGLILALIALVCFGAFGQIGGNLNITLNQIAAAIGGGGGPPGGGGPGLGQAVGTTGALGMPGPSGPQAGVAAGTGQ